MEIVPRPATSLCTTTSVHSKRRRRVAAGRARLRSAPVGLESVSRRSTRQSIRTKVTQCSAIPICATVRPRRSRHRATSDERERPISSGLRRCGRGTDADSEERRRAAQARTRRSRSCWRAARSPAAPSRSAGSRRSTTSWSSARSPTSTSTSVSRPARSSRCRSPRGITPDEMVKVLEGTSRRHRQLAADRLLQPELARVRVAAGEAALRPLHATCRASAATSLRGAAGRCRTRFGPASRSSRASPATPTSKPLAMALIEHVSPTREVPALTNHIPSGLLRQREPRALAAPQSRAHPDAERLPRLRAQARLQALRHRLRSRHRGARDLRRRREQRGHDLRRRCRRRRRCRSSTSPRASTASTTSTAACATPRTSTSRSRRAPT